jgi:ATP:ADP antiporter, AAA family
MTAFLQRTFNIRREEAAPVLASGLFFFCILTALMVLRPAREALGMRGGLDAVYWLFMGTAIVTLAVNPAFGFLVARFRRLTFITATYMFFAASLFVFYLLLVMRPETMGETTGRVFYVWFSVFNLFVTMVFWALMADRFSLEQSKRFFAFIAVGGTLGALFGPWLASLLAEPFGTPALLLVAIGFLSMAVGAAWTVAHLQPERATMVEAGDPDAPPAVDERTVIGGSAWEGFRAVFRSRYLLGIAAFVLILAVLATFLYFTRLQMVAALGDDLDMRTRIFAEIDMITQLTTLVLQVIVTGHVMKRFGVHVALAVLPIIMILGFIGLAVIGSLAALIVVEALNRAVQRAITRPARETLFTIVSREDKYKSKAFIDTFGIRIGDVFGSRVEWFLGWLGLGLVGLAAVAVPLAAVWAALGIWLGLAQRKHAIEQREAARRAKVAAMP